MNGQRLKDARKAARYTVQLFADALGVTRNTIFRWEKNENSPTDEMKRKIAETLGVSVSYLMGDDATATAAPTPAPTPAPATPTPSAPLPISDVAAILDRARLAAASMTDVDRALCAKMFRLCAEAMERDDDDSRTDGTCGQAGDGSDEMAG